MKFCDNPECENHVEVPAIVKSSRILEKPEKDTATTYTKRQVRIHQFVGPDRNHIGWFCDGCRKAMEILRHAEGKEFEQ